MSKAYNLPQSQIHDLAIICYREQGSNDAGVRACASHMCNYYERYQTAKYSSPYYCTLKSGWYGKESFNLEWIRNHPNVPSSVESAVQDVINGGHRSIPDYVDEYDCLTDVRTATNYGVGFPPEDRSQYIKDVTKIVNVYGSSYTFYCFPDGASGYCDAFGYISKPDGTEEPGTVVSGRKTVYFGVSGSDVALLQKLLNRLGYAGADGQPLEVDGIAGLNTVWAIRCYQSDHGLEPDGICGKMTWQSIIKEAVS